MLYNAKKVHSYVKLDEKMNVLLKYELRFFFFDSEPVEFAEGSLEAKWKTLAFENGTKYCPILALE